jgi:tetratricopeptide (TPR) repeat protein
MRALGRLEEARQDAEVALTLARQAANAKQAASMLLAVGMAEFQLGALASAERRYAEGVDEARAAGDRALEATLAQQLGAVRQSLGDAESAHAHLSGAYAMALEAGDDLAEMRAAAGLGSFHLERDDVAESEHFYERALFLAEQHAVQRTHRIVLGYLGTLRFSAGDLEAAELCLRRAARRSREVGDIRVEAFFEGIRGAVLATMDRVDEAVACLELADALLEAWPFFRKVIQIHRGHVDLALARRTRDPAEAAAHDRAARFRIEAARQASREDDGAPIAACSDDARIAIRILERALARSAGQT